MILRILVTVGSIAIIIHFGSKIYLQYQKTKFQKKQEKNNNNLEK